MPSKITINEKPFLIYLEDAPLNKCMAGTGLSKAFNATLSGLASELTRLCIVQTHQYFSPQDFAEDWSSQPAWVAPQADRLVARFCAFLPWRLACLLAKLHGRSIARRLRQALPGLLPAGARLFSPVGVDALTLVRGESIANALSAGFEPYLVDDIESHPSNMHWQGELSDALTKLLNRATRIYSITDGLSSLLHKRYQVEVCTLHLAADLPELSADKKNSCLQKTNPNFAFFLGSINHLYSAGLRLLIQQVDELREQSQSNLTIRISSSPDQVRDALGLVPSWVIVGQVQDQNQLQHEISESTFCFLPYSFTQESRSMVESSFPSKMIDYLTHANAILIFGPESSTPVQFLRDHNLPYACTTSKSMREHLLLLLNDRPELNMRYRIILSQVFSVETMRQTLKFRANYL